MITHIVFFKFTNKTTDAVNGLVSLLKNMEGKVESLRHLEVGIDYRGTERSQDVSLITKFPSREDLEAYGSHSAHVRVLNYMKENNIKTVIVDYES